METKPGAETHGTQTLDVRMKDTSRVKQCVCESSLHVPVVSFQHGWDFHVFVLRLEVKSRMC